MLEPLTEQFPEHCAHALPAALASNSSGMCEWLGREASVPDAETTADPWIPNHSKIPLDSNGEYARELLSRPQQRRHLLSFLGECLLVSMGGYLSNIGFKHHWDMVWTVHEHPGTALQAARCLRRPPDELAVWSWCRLYYPTWVKHVWPSGIHETKLIWKPWTSD